MVEGMVQKVPLDEAPPLDLTALEGHVLEDALLPLDHSAAENAEVCIRRACPAELVDQGAVLEHDRNNDIAGVHRALEVFEKIPLG